MNPTLSNSTPEGAVQPTGFAPARSRLSGKSFVFGALVVLNALLAIMFINKHTPDQTAVAQVGRPSDFLMVPGTVTGVSTGVVFIVDTSTGELSALTYNDTRDVLTPLPKIDLNQVFKAGVGVAPGGGGGVKPAKPR